MVLYPWGGAGERERERETKGEMILLEWVLATQPLSGVARRWMRSTSRAPAPRSGSPVVGALKLCAM